MARHTVRAREADRIDRIISARTAGLTTAQLLKILAQADVPHGKIYQAADIATDEHYAARETVVRRHVESIGDVAMPAPVPRLEVTPGRIDHLGPALGAHTDQVLSQLCGLTPETLARLRRSGVI